VAARDAAPARDSGTSPAPGSGSVIGVLLDAIIVRSVLVTALNLDIGDRMWWPSRLARPASQVTGVPSTPVTTGHP
jgi:RND superfamily putative drug exporter